MARPINLSSATELWQGCFFPQCAEVVSVGCKVTDVHMVNLFQPPSTEGPWLHGGCCRCPQDPEPPAGRDLGLNVFCPVQKMCCFLGSSTSTSWEPVELQSSASVHEVRAWLHFPVTAWTGNSTRTWTHTVRGPWLSDASSIPSIHPSWVLPFCLAYRKQQKPQSCFSSPFLPYLTPSSTTKTRCEVS